MTALVCTGATWALWHYVQQCSETEKLSAELLKVNDLVTQSAFYWVCPPCEGHSEMVCGTHPAIFCLCVPYNDIHYVRQHILSYLGTIKYLYIAQPITFFNCSLILSSSMMKKMWLLPLCLHGRPSLIATWKLVHVHEDLIICVCHLDFPMGWNAQKQEQINSTIKKDLPWLRCASSYSSVCLRLYKFVLMLLYGNQMSEQQL